jgi:hypothetical protein
VGTAALIALPVLATAQTQTTSTQSSSQSQTPQSVGASDAREHLTKARQSLADLTALPQAQQLQGEARNKVSQLISQFNQLITTQDDWRPPYNDVNTTLTALLEGPASPTPSTSSSTTGAVGTSGISGAAANATLDPAIRTKLEEFRTRLQAFYAAAGGEGSAGSASAEAETHIAAIEGILNEASGGTSTSGTTGTASAGATGPVTLDGAKLEQIRMHLQQLRQSIRR